DLFFFSSRRRHTRSKRDWSSDVCSSDLSKPSCFIFSHNISLSDDGMDCVCAHYSPSFPACPHKPFYIFLHLDFHSREKSTGTVQIGRASCRERVSCVDGRVSVSQQVRGT